MIKFLIKNWGGKREEDGARWRVRTSDPYRVKVRRRHFWRETFPRINIGEQAQNACFQRFLIFTVFAPFRTEPNGLRSKTCFFRHQTGTIRTMPKVTRCLKNGKKQFLLDYGIVGGRRRRSFHRTRAEAETVCF